ncbi:MAG: hypothetical protein HY819_21065 [Acidobacteria bacterium]|nr:hypothetical protein [Acidobacteriota bacterium]
MTIIDELEKQIRNLSDADKLQLFERFSLVSPIIENHITIEIDDMSRGREESPRAILHYSDGSKKGIDILESVKKNPVSIGHPAILLAIRRWEQLVRLNKIFFEDVYNDKYPPIEDYNQSKIKQNKQIATYLKDIGAALYKSAKERELSRETAFKLYVDYLGLDKQDTYLYKAWKLLKTEEFKKIQNVSVKLDELRKQLNQEKDVKPYKISINRVIDFFTSDTGARFFYKPYDWPGTRNTFLGWRFKVQKNTVKDYNFRADDEDPTSQGIDKHLILADFFDKYNFSQIGDSFLLPVVETDVNDIKDDDEEGVDQK